jgi:glutathione S-transferase
MTAPGKITLWGRKSSANVQKVLWTLAELSLPYEHIPAGGDFGGLSDAAYLAMNPNGRIPTLKDGDLVVWESDAIVRYLAARYGAGTLWPEDPAERAIADQWMTWGTTELEVDWLWLFWRLVRTPPSKRDPQAIARHHEATVARFKLLDGRLQGRDYLGWEKEAAVHDSTGAHGRVRSYFNATYLQARRTSTYPMAVGAMSVKELYSGGNVSGFAVGIKTQAGTAASSWTWFESYGLPSVAYFGPGDATCEGCHKNDGGRDRSLTANVP